MDYKQKYIEALERAKAWREKYVKKCIYEHSEMIHEFDEIFPEPKEIDDEKIRKMLIEWTKSLQFRLESQTKQKFTEEDEKILSDVVRLIRDGALSKEEKEFYAESPLSLPLQKHWKPSERELNAILAAIGDERQKGSDVAKELLNVYRQLKAL